MRTTQIERLALGALVAAAVLAGSPAEVAAGRPRERRAKNVILMVPDGMALSNVTAARILKSGVGGDRLSFETLGQIGYQRNYSADSTVTDSAAAASAWACGERFANGELCAHADGRPHPPNILELASASGRATGLVATSTVTHATPAAFGAHVASRGCENEIARQYLELTRPDVILGGGLASFTATTPDACGAAGQWLPKAGASGYVVVRTKAEMQTAVGKGARKLLGLFSQAGLTPESLRPPDTPEPRLPEMTAAALGVLEKNKHGFFVMIEGSQIDWANHETDLPYLLGEMLAFDEAVRVVLRWIEARPERRAETLLIVTPDHHTGGLTISGPRGHHPAAGEVVDVAWANKVHGGEDVVFWSQGPRSQALGRAIDNTDLYRVMREALSTR